MGLLDSLFGNSKKEKDRNQTITYTAGTKLPADVIEDNRSSFYSLADIKHRRLGPGFMLSPYDAQAYYEFQDAIFLPAIANTDKIKRFLPGLGFTNDVECKKRLKGYLYKTEQQLGVTYVIRYNNNPAGMIFVNSPLYNKQTINLSIWTIDFFIWEKMEHNGIMYNSILRVLNEMKTAMGAKYVYAMVDQDNTDCINLLGNGLFKKIDNTGFRSSNSNDAAPLVYMINLETIRFERRG